MNAFLIYVGESITFIVGVLSAIAIYRKNKNYIGNRLMASSLLCFGLYSGAVLFYDVVKTEIVVQIFLRIGLIFAVLGSVFMYFAVKVMEESSEWLTKQRVFTFSGLLLIGALLIIFLDLIEVRYSEGMVDSTLKDIPIWAILYFGFIVIVLLGGFLKAILNVIRFGIVKGIGETKRRMISFIIGIVFLLIAIGSAILSNTLENSHFFDILLAVFVAIAMIFWTRSFLIVKNVEKPEKKSIESIGLRKSAVY
jgi:hypothetical protein